MLKTGFLIFILGVLIVAFFSAVHLYRVAQKNEKEMARYQQTVKANPQTGKTLVVYYSLQGHTRAIAEKIAALTNADVYQIETEEKIELNKTFYLRARQSLKSGNYPKLAGKLPDFEAYDTIFVGAPVWWYAPATPLLAFLQKADFKTRKVVPFSTQGSNYGSFFVDFEKMAKNAKLRPSASFNNLPAKYDAEVDNKIATWVNSIK